MGWGSKVMAMEGMPSWRARETTSAITHWWPRCTPSKLPMVAMVGPNRWGLLRAGGRSSSGNLEFNLQAVVGETDVRWKRGLGGGVVEVVAHVGEEGAAWLELFDVGDGLLKMRVAVVRIAPEGIDDEEVEVLKESDAFVGDVAHVGEVGGAAEAVAGDLLAAVGDGDALEAGSEEIEACAGRGVDAVKFDAGAGGIAVFGAEGVLEDSLDGRGGVVVGVDGEVAFGVKAEGAEVVEAHDVVGVAVGVEDCIDAADVFADGLGVKVRTSVDEDGVAVVGEANGWPGAAVARVAAG